MLTFTLALVAGCASGPNYQYRKAPLVLPAGNGALTGDDAQFEEALKMVAASPLCATTFSKMFTSVLLVMSDLPDVTFSGFIKDGACTVEKGTKAGVVFDYVLPADKQNIIGLAGFFEDGKLADDELYQLNSVTFLSGLRAGFRAEPFYREDVARYLALPNLMHFTLLNANGFEYRGSKAQRTATAMNVDGEWIIVEGHHGTATMAVEVTVEQLAEYSTLVFGASDEPPEARLPKFKAFLAKVAKSK